MPETSFLLQAQIIVRADVVDVEWTIGDDFEDHPSIARPDVMRMPAGSASTEPEGPRSGREERNVRSSTPGESEFAQRKVNIRVG
jgi:hypothetical protein